MTHTRQESIKVKQEALRLILIHTPCHGSWEERTLRETREITGGNKEGDTETVKGDET